MKVFLSIEAKEDGPSMLAFVKALKASKVSAKVYLLGDEIKRDWDIVERYDLDGMIKSIPELKRLV